MVITWFGRNCFRLEGEQTSILTDPYTTKCGLTPPRVTPDIVTISHVHGEEITAKNVKKETFLVEHLGEYEYHGAFIWGIPTETRKGEQNNAFLIQLDQMNLAHLGDLGHELADAQLEQFNRVDILLIPVGGGDALDAALAAKVIGQIEPKMVIPMHYKIPGFRGDAAPINAFKKELGATSVSEQDRIRVRQRDLTGEEMQIVILRRP